MPEICYTVNVGLWFHPADAKRLRELASPAWTRRPEDRKLFMEAATATESGAPLLVQTMTQGKLDQIVGVFRNRGIQHAPLVEQLRLGPTPRDGLTSRNWSG